jgi:DNA-binding HxlR family transcriptional regulator
MSPRSYEDACGAALAMDVVGERWALLVVRELVFGPKRFRDLRAGLPNASQNVLSQRLRELEESGIVRRTELGPPVSAHVYELTDRGRQLEPVLIALSRWGAGQHSPDETTMSTDAFMLLLKALYRPQPAGTPPLAVTIAVGADAFAIDVSPAEVAVARGAHATADLSMNGSVDTLRAIIFANRDVQEAITAGDLALTGDLEVARRFFTLFGVPALT